MDAETREYVRAARAAVVQDRLRAERKFFNKQPWVLGGAATSEQAKGKEVALALSGSAKELKPLLDAIKENGFKVAPSGKHHKVVDVEGKLGAKGKIVTDSNGPIIISSTPGDFRARDMHVKRLMAAKIIKRDPWAKDKGEGVEDRKGGGITPERRAAMRAAIAEESRRRHQRTVQLRSRIEPIISKLGGWERRGMLAELGRTAYVFLASKNRVENWKSESGAMQNVLQLKKGNTLSDQSVDAWSIFCDELEKAWRPGPGQPLDDERLRKRYFDMVRAAKGIPVAPPDTGAGAAVKLPTRSTPVRELDEGEPEAPLAEAPRANGHRSSTIREGLLGERVPTLALEAVYLMAAAGNGDANDPARMDKVMTVGEKILAMEIKELG